MPAARNAPIPRRLRAASVLVCVSERQHRNADCDRDCKQELGGRRVIGSQCRTTSTMPDASLSGSALLPACNHAPRKSHSPSEREALVPGKFVIKKGPTGKFRFSLVSTNGQIVASSQAYENKAAAMRGVASVQKLAAGARIVDLTVAAAAPAASLRQSRLRTCREEACREACREEAGGEEACGEEACGKEEVGRAERAGVGPRASSQHPPLGDGLKPVADRRRAELPDRRRIRALHARRRSPANSASRSSATISPTRRQISGTLPARWAERIVPGVVRARSVAGMGSSGKTSIAARMWPEAAASRSAGQSTTPARETRTTTEPRRIVVEAVALRSRRRSRLSPARARRRRGRAGRDREARPVRRRARRRQCRRATGRGRGAHTRTGAGVAEAPARGCRSRRARPSCQRAGTSRR